MVWQSNRCFGSLTLHLSLSVWRVAERCGDAEMVLPLRRNTAGKASARGAMTWD